MKAISKEATKVLEALTQGLNNHRSIENTPYMRLVIENIGEITGVGTGKGQLISMAHYAATEFGEDAITDPEVCFIKCVTGVMNKKTYEIKDEVQYYPYYIKYNNGMEFEYIRFANGDYGTAKFYQYMGCTQNSLAAFVNTWCRNIKQQGFLKAMKAT